MSHPDAPSSPPPPRTFSSKTFIGVVCFSVGLLIVAAGVLLVVRWILTGDAVAVLVGALLVFIGFATNITGLVLLYRGVTRLEQQTGDENGTSRLGRQGGSNDGS